LAIWVQYQENGAAQQKRIDNWCGAYKLRASGRENVPRNFSGRQPA
jgi:hypothetical protein